MAESNSGMNTTQQKGADGTGESTGRKGNAERVAQLLVGGSSFWFLCG